MVSRGKCPKCQIRIAKWRADQVGVSFGVDQRSFSAIAIICPECETTISVFPDPADERTDLLDQIGALLAKTSPRIG